MVRRFSKAGTAGRVSVAGLRLRRTARDVQPPADRVREDVVRAALAADLRGLEDLVRPVGAGLEGESRGREERTHDE